MGITIKQYRWDQAIMKKAHEDIKSLLEAPEADHLGDWLQNMHLDLKTKIKMKKAEHQYHIMLEKWMALREHAYAKHKGDGWHIDNEAWADFEDEFAKFIKYRKELVHTPFGEELKKRIMALRKLPAFQDLKKQWFLQCHTKSGEAFKFAFDE